MAERVMYEVINDSRTREEMRHLLMDKVGVCIADPLDASQPLYFTNPNPKKDLTEAQKKKLTKFNIEYRVAY